MNTRLPKYDFNNPIFKQRRQLIRLAKDHMDMATLKSDRIEWGVLQTTVLDIPIVYQVTYHIRSIVGIDADQNPIYGNRHVAEMSLGPLYPLEPCKVYMKTDVWHPNIKWDGRLKGRVCSNVDKFGVAFDLYSLVTWVGEILQYKNYHAKHEPPFPEDITVAEWVLNYAEPRSIVNKEKGIFVDDNPLLRVENGLNLSLGSSIEQPSTISKEIETLAAGVEPMPSPEPDVAIQPPIPFAPPPTVVEETHEDSPSIDSKFKISLIRKGPPPQSPPNSSIKINPRNT